MSTESVESHSGYTLRGRGDIIEKLTLMQKKKCLLSAQAKSSAHSFVTTVLKILPDKGLVVLDISENASTNQKVTAAEQTVISTKVDGIQSRFVLGPISEAKLNGQPVFAAALPDSVFWFQQRKFFRVTVPIAMATRCAVLLDDEVAEFGVIDLSISGLALYDKTIRINDAFDVGHRFDACTLIIPNHGEIKLALAVRNKVTMTWANPPTSQRVGCEFQDLSRTSELNLQKFIFEIELQKKRQDSIVRG